MTSLEARAEDKKDNIYKEEKAECAICYDDVDHHIALTLPCKHRFHPVCVNDWARQNAGQEMTCPQCRAAVSQQVLQDIQKPIGWLDMLVLPVMLAVMLIQAVCENTQAGVQAFCKAIKAYLVQKFHQITTAIRRLPHEVIVVFKTCLQLLTRIVVAMFRCISVALKKVVARLYTMALSAKSSLDLCLMAAQALWRRLQKLCRKLWVGLRKLARNLLETFLWITEPVGAKLTVVVSTAKFYLACFGRALDRSLDSLSTIARLCFLRSVHAFQLCSIRVFDFLCRIFRTVRETVSVMCHSVTVSLNRLAAFLAVTYHTAVRTLVAALVRAHHIAARVAAHVTALAWPPVQKTLAKFMAVCRLAWVKCGVIWSSLVTVVCGTWESMAAAGRRVVCEACVRMAAGANKTAERLREITKQTQQLLSQFLSWIVFRIRLVHTVVTAHAKTAFFYSQQAWRDLVLCLLTLLVRFFRLSRFIANIVIRQCRYTANIVTENVHRFIANIVTENVHRFFRLSRYTANIVTENVHLFVRALADTFAQLCKRVENCNVQLWMSVENVAHVVAKCIEKVVAWALRRIPVKLFEEKFKSLARFTGKVAHLVTGKMNDLTKIFEKVVKATKAMIWGCLEAVGEFVERRGQVVWNLLTKISARFSHLLQAVFRKLCNGLQSVNSKLWQGVRIVFGLFQAVFRKLCNGLQAVNSKLWQGARIVFGFLWTLENYLGWSMDCLTHCLADTWLFCSKQMSVLTEKLLCGLLEIVRFGGKIILQILCFGGKSLALFLSALWVTVNLVLSTLYITVCNVVYRPRCAVCKRGAAKLRTLCFTCVGDHLVPRCYDCGRGWCKIGSRCFTCFKDYIWPRCSVCRRGHVKLKQRCWTCLVDLVIPRCSVCGRGWQKLRARCLTCLVDLFIHRCSVCGRGWNKIGSHCFTCYRNHCLSLLSHLSSHLYRSLRKECMDVVGRLVLRCTFPKCVVCHRGYGKVQGLCWTCLVDVYHKRCSDCKRGWSKIGSLCTRCYLSRAFPPCGKCNRGCAKIRMRCFTCYKQYLLHPPPCFVCHVGCAKIAGRCFRCYSKSILDPPKCRFCLRGFQKVGDRCFSCHVAFMKETIKARLELGKVQLSTAMSRPQAKKGALSPPLSSLAISPSAGLSPFPLLPSSFSTTPLASLNQDAIPQQKRRGE
eukprot:gb/GEZN01000726.1/.p1 GENE.gb/GEZN01000726.1/~~gb/GEZN01000726.1/.p1  ORF type:complete len:1170 (+),score=92.22 gb/GEZN01000726.1/:58-3567(+)